MGGGFDIDRGFGEGCAPTTRYHRVTVARCSVTVTTHDSPSSRSSCRPRRRRHHHANVPTRRLDGPEKETAAARRLRALAPPPLAPLFVRSDLSFLLDRARRVAPALRTTCHLHHPVRNSCTRGRRLEREGSAQPPPPGRTEPRASTDGWEKFCRSFVTAGEHDAIDNSPTTVSSSNIACETAPRRSLTLKIWPAARPRGVIAGSAVPTLTTCGPHECF